MVELGNIQDKDPAETPVGCASVSPGSRHYLSPQIILYANRQRVDPVCPIVLKTYPSGQRAA